jgi:hypothetical protein
MHVVRSSKFKLWAAAPSLLSFDGAVNAMASANGKNGVLPSPSPKKRA